MAAHEDRRTRKTKKAMTAALARLLLEKPLNSISVKEIADIADINRGTFYLHYRDVYDMAEQIQIEIFGKFAEIVEMYVHEKKNDELFPMMVAVFNLLIENSELAKVLIGKNGDAGFVDKLKNIIREKCFSNIRTVFNFKNDGEFDYFCNYFVSGCIGLCNAWLLNDMKETPAEMAEF